MLNNSLNNPALRKRASQFTRLVRHSAVTPRTGETHKPQLVTNGELGLTFIGHSSFFLQIGGQSVVIDPNFARWLFDCGNRACASAICLRWTWCW